MTNFEKYKIWFLQWNQFSARIAFVGHDGCNNLVNGSFVSRGQSPVAPGNWWIFSCDFERWYIAKGDFILNRFRSSRTAIT